MSDLLSLRRAAGVVLAVTSAAIMAGPAGAAKGANQDAAPASAAIVDVVVLDREGRFVGDLRPADFAVSVDGVRRNVLWARRVSRGPGAAAEASAARQARQSEGLTFGAEPARTVLLLVDESSLPRGEERDIVQGAESFLDRLGLDDRVAVLRLPAASRAEVALTTERPDAREALSQVTGRLARQVLSVSAEPAPRRSVDPERMTGLEPDQGARTDPAAAATPEDAAADEAEGRVRGSVPALRAVFESLGRLPGRKVVALFSAGLPGAATPLVDDAAFAAVAAHVVVYAFGGRTVSVDPRSPVSSAPLERLALATGGAYLRLGRDPARIAERAATELGACYVLGLEPAASERGGRRGLRVETTRKGATIRSAGWVVARRDAADLVSDPARPAAEAGPAAPAADPPRPRERDTGRDAELPLALARLFQYVDGYERQYSILVAQEEYRQSAPQGNVHLRSDVLLVRLPESGEWVSFRDVFEVDSRPVRDREDRLRRLFLDPAPGGIARLEAIHQESARYNVGVVERTVNVPLLPLSFLRAENRNRFDYEMAGRTDAGGVQAWRIRYKERERPTMIADRQHRDLPVSGWFIVDVLTGAVVESRMEARQWDSRAAITVRYRRDPRLGLWVPADMSEAYTTPESGGGRWGNAGRATVEGRATYSNFRRFQVKTEEKIAPPK